MSENKSWYEVGFAGADREQEKRDLGSGPDRWWLSAGQTKLGVFIDDQPVAFNEHSWRVGDSKDWNYATCLASLSAEGCPADGARGVQKADYIGHLTIVDITGYKTRDGKEVKYQIKEFPPKLKVMNQLKLKKAAKGSLIDILWSILRTDKDSPNTGNDFTEVRPAKMDELYKVVTYKGKNLSEMIEKANGHSEESAKMRRYLAHNFQIPAEGEIPQVIPALNYAKLHAPMSPADLRKAIAGASGFTGGFGGGGGGNTPSGPATSDDVPF